MTPTSSNPLRIGTRSSPLALAQAEMTKAALLAAHGWDEAAILLVPMLSSGDKVQDRPLAEIGGKAGKSVVNTVTSGKESAVATVETHPFYAILAASAAAFLLGRMSVAPERGVAERTYDRLHDLALRLEPRVSEALRSRMR